MRMRMAWLCWVVAGSAAARAGAATLTGTVKGGAEGQPPLTPGERMQERLAESAPLLAVAMLALLAVLGVGALMVLAMRRASQAPEALPEYEELPEPEQAAAGAAAAAPVELSPER